MMNSKLWKVFSEIQKGEKVEVSQDEAKDILGCRKGVEELFQSEEREGKVVLSCSEQVTSCSYCSKLIKKSESIQAKLFFRRQGRVASEYRTYCKGTSCAGYNQMAHEG